MLITRSSFRQKFASVVGLSKGLCDGRLPVDHSCHFLLAALFMLTLPAQAQQSGEWSAYTSMRTIQDLLVEPDAVWAITSGGVLRFDRQQRTYTRFTRLEGLAGNQVSSVAVDRRGDLWFGTNRQGLSRFRPATNSFTPPFLEFQQRDIKALSATDEALFVGTERGISVLSLDREEVRENYRQLGRLPKDTAVQALAVFANRLWAGTPSGLAWADLRLPNLQDPDSWTSVSIGQVSAFSIFSDTLFCATSHGVWHMGADRQYPALDLGGVRVIDLTVFAGRLAALTADGLLLQRQAAESWMPDTTIAVLSGAQAIAQVDEALWVATSAGLQVVGGQPPPPVREPAANYFFEMAMSGSGELWVASVPKDNIPPFGAYQFDGSAWTVHNQASGLSSNFASTVEFDAADQVWVGTWGRGVAVRDTAANWQILDQTNSVLRGLRRAPSFVPISDMARDAGGLMWVANVQAGLAVLDGFPPTRQFLHEQEKLKIQGDMDNLAIGPDGVKWVATAVEGFVLFDDGGDPFGGGNEYAQLFNVTSESRLTSNRILDIMVDSRGRLWVATDNGLNLVRGVYSRLERRFRLDDWQVYNTGNGLPSNSVTALSEDSQGNIWVGTQAGLARIAPGGRVSFALTTDNSGLIDNRINSLLFDPRHGDLWVGTLDGLSRLQLGKGRASQTAGALVYPNPFVLGRHDPRLTFSRLPLGATVDIFTFDGRLVHRLEGVPGQGSLVWNGQNEAGFLVASGLYFFVAGDAAGNRVRGKFAVLHDP